MQKLHTTFGLDSVVESSQKNRWYHFRRSEQMYGNRESEWINTWVPMPHFFNFEAWTKLSRKLSNVKLSYDSSLWHAIHSKSLQRCDKLLGFQHFVIFWLAMDNKKICQILLLSIIPTELRLGDHGSSIVSPQLARTLTMACKIRVPRSWVSVYTDITDKILDIMGYP